MKNLLRVVRQPERGRPTRRAAGLRAEEQEEGNVPTQG